MPDLDRTAPPLPGRVVIRQRWSDLVFVHWRVPPAAVAPFLPTGTRPDVFDGDAWVGLIPFELSRSAFPPLPPVPYLGTFLEINVRLYSIDDAGNRGVVFRSLDAARLIPVLTAQAAFGLPYRFARMSRRVDDGTLEYVSRRAARPHPSTRIVARPGVTPVDDALSRFLTARWGFHERVRGRTVWARNHHEPWPLVGAELVDLDDELVAAAGFPGLADRAPDSVLFSPGVSTVFSAPRPL